MPILRIGWFLKFRIRKKCLFRGANFTFTESIRSCGGNLILPAWFVSLAGDSGRFEQVVSHLCVN